MSIPDNNPWHGFEHAPRQWQADARPLALEAIARGTPGIISAVMGAGKSALIGEICHSLDESAKVIVTTPTVRLVEQLAESIQSRFVMQRVGRFYGRAKEPGYPVVVCCLPSVPKLADLVDCDVWIADEAHRTECDTIFGSYQKLSPRAAIGFTATPFRAEQTEKLSLFEELIYEYTAADAIQDNVVVEPRLVHYTGDSTDLDEVCESLIGDAVSDDLGPGLVNAMDIEDAEGFAEQLSATGVASQAVHSRRTDEENNDVMERLRTSDLDCVVHVNMLSEGVDFPWLRWLCMRRPVSSRVRFCQEVGRVLRADEGKDCAWLFDPHDLFGEFGLTYEAVLAGGKWGVPDRPENEAAVEVDRTLDAIEERASEGATIETDNYGVPVQVVGPVRSWLRKTKLACISSGMAENKITSTHWRGDPPSDKQLSMVGSWLGNYATSKAPVGTPSQHKRAAKAAIRAATLGALNKGDVSDLMTILFTLKECDVWPFETEDL